MRVLVTGISGRIGGLVARELLEAGHEIVGFDKNPPYEEFRERVEMVYDDITDRLALLRAAAIQLSIWRRCPARERTPTKRSCTSTSSERNTFWPQPKRTISSVS